MIAKIQFFHSFYSTVEHINCLKAFLAREICPAIASCSLLIVSITLAHSAQSVRISPDAELCCAAALKDLNDAFPRVSKWFVYGIQRAIPRKEKKNETKRNEQNFYLPAN
jgi:hypothetical protein